MFGRIFLGKVRLAQRDPFDPCAGAREDVKQAHFRHQSDIEALKDNQEILQDRIDAGEKNLENSFEALQIKALREAVKKSYADLQKKLKVLQNCLDTLVMQPIRPDEAFAQQTMTPPPIASGQVTSESMQAQGKCPPYQFPIDPQHPEFGCRGAVATGGLPGLPFGSASIMPGTLSPGSGVATSFAGMGRIRVMNLGK